MSNINLESLRKHIKKYVTYLNTKPEEHKNNIDERRERVRYYQSWTAEKIISMTPEDLYQYISRLFAMLIWGNKQYVVDKVIDDNGFDNFKKRLADLVWGSDSIEKRWDTFRTSIKGIGPAMTSEILCYVYPDKCMLWNRRAYVAFNYLQVDNLPRYNYQLTGKVYLKLCEIAKSIAREMVMQGMENADLLDVDYFIWQELQVEDNLSQIHKKQNLDDPEEIVDEQISKTKETSEFIHNEIRDKLAEIGTWLGFKAGTEKKVAEGSKVDAIWEATIGNMGRVIYVFEVQTKGSIDSLIVNLLKSLNNPAVQCVVAVSDKEQLEKIRRHAETLKDFQNKIRYWDYQEVLGIHSNLELAYESINRLKLVPQGFSL